MKPSYEELKRKTEQLERRLANLERAMQEADRHKVVYYASEWVSMPLHPHQKQAVSEVLQDRLRYGEWQDDGEGNRLYEEVHECSILPEFRYLLVRYTTDAHGNHIDVPQVWGLIPY